MTVISEMSFHVHVHTFIQLTFLSAQNPYRIELGIFHEFTCFFPWFMSTLNNLIQHTEKNTNVKD